jgi:lipocalin
MILSAVFVAVAAAPLPTQDWVDLARYAGRWYEIARLPTSFQEQCASDVVATYTVRDDGRVTGAGERTGPPPARKAWPAARTRTARPRA